jgi:hypothetical protein
MFFNNSFFSIEQLESVNYLYFVFILLLFKNSKIFLLIISEVDEKIALLPACVRTDKEEIVYSIESPIPLTHATDVTAIFIPDYYSEKFQGYIYLEE